MRAFLTDTNAWTGSAAGVPAHRGPSPLMRGLRPRALPRGLARACDTLAETLWTTRCIICDAPGSTLCADCLLRLPYIDRWRACPRCGAPNGILVCTDCNSLMLHEAGRTELPFERCVNAIEHSGPARDIIVGYKDAGERRLARDIARIMGNAVPREWMHPACTVSYVPADRRARLRRSFDHMELIAREFASIAGMPCRNLLLKEGGHDQRGLDRRQRFQNMAHRVHPRPGAEGIGEVLLLDDVHTTGATLFAACDALHAAGVPTVRCATFARAV